MHTFHSWSSWINLKCEYVRLVFVMPQFFPVDTVVNNIGEQGESEGLQFSSTRRKYHLIDRLNYVCAGNEARTVCILLECFLAEIFLHKITANSLEKYSAIEI